MKLYIIFVFKIVNNEVICCSHVQRVNYEAMNWFHGQSSQILKLQLASLLHELIIKLNIIFVFKVVNNEVICCLHVQRVNYEAMNWFHGQSSQILKLQLASLLHEPIMKPHTIDMFKLVNNEFINGLPVQRVNNEATNWF